MCEKPNIKNDESVLDSTGVVSVDELKQCIRCHTGKEYDPDKSPIKLDAANLKKIEDESNSEEKRKRIIKADLKIIDKWNKEDNRPKVVFAPDVDQMKKTRKEIKKSLMSLQKKTEDKDLVVEESVEKSQRDLGIDVLIDAEDVWRVIDDIIDGENLDSMSVNERETMYAEIWRQVKKIEEADVLHAFQEINDKYGLVDDTGKRQEVFEQTMTGIADRWSKRLEKVYDKLKCGQEYGGLFIFEDTGKGRVLPEDKQAVA